MNNFHQGSLTISGSPVLPIQRPLVFYSYKYVSFTKELPPLLTSYKESSLLRAILVVSERLRDLTMVALTTAFFDIDKFLKHTN